MLEKLGAACVAAMAKLLRKCKNWFSYHGRALWITLVVLAALGGAVYYAVTTNEKTEQVDFGDTILSELAQEVSNLGYQDGVELLDEGESVKGRAVMRRLAPLNLASKTPQGNANAHLWMAQNLLAGRGFGFLSAYPLAKAGGKRLVSPVLLDKGDLTARCQRHLESAVSLDPQLEEATVMLAEVLLAQGQRNEAVGLLHQSVASHARIELSIQLANLLSYVGDDLELEEVSWHGLATLGREVTGRKRGDLGVRMDYILYALVLKQFDLASSAIGKFERDFGEGNEAVLKSVRVSQWYFKAVQLLEEDHFSESRVCEYLLKAHSIDPGRSEVVAALKLLVARYPDVKGMMQQGIGEVSLQLEKDNPLAAVDLHVLLAKLNPASAQRHMMRAHSLNAEDPSLVVAWAAFQLQEEAPDFLALEKSLVRLTLNKNLSRAELYSLLFTLGEVRAAEERWAEALQAFEQALTVSDGLNKDLHKMLAQAYAALGQDIIADEHRAQAAQ